MPSGPTSPVTTTYPQGAKPTYAGAPGLPTFVFKQGDWPAEDVVVDTSSSQVATWMKELQGYDIPDIPTTDGTCAGSPNSTANAAANGWWSCGHYTRPTDIVACPDKFTWGVSFDDGPAPYTQTLLNYLTEKNIFATFFVVGSRVIEYPQVLREEYMAGHEISVHTWSHRPLTSLTNEQIVGELGWTRAAIKAVLGVTPTTMRPPYGDIDDRVRAISLAMGLIPIIWTSTPQAGAFDTNDWRVAGGLVTGPQSYASFEAILGNASVIDTGFIVLEHDLYEITVDMATGYTLNAALTHNPPFTLEPIGQCVKMPVTDLYRETTTNTSFPYPLPSGATDPTTGGSSAGSNVAKSAALSFKVPLGGILIIFGLLAWVL
jgi:peptidoglycan/xylan/chitin deacetylase (PgdA/CDA1 family)